MTPGVSRYFNNSAAISRGPLVYALKIDEEWKQVQQDLPHRDLPHVDWEVYPTSRWNFALGIGVKSISNKQNFAEMPMSDAPFSPGGGAYQG
jgi:uncharacterized protein